MSKQCTKCKKIKDLDAFKSRIRNNKTTYLSKCKKCYKEYNIKWSLNNQEKLRSNRLKCHYDMTLDQYKQMSVKQNGVCAVCLDAPTKKSINGVLRSLSVDHCHDTGKIRGLLCDACNTSLGLLKDNVEIINNLANYIMKSREDK